MKRVLVIKATKGGITAKVRIEVECHDLPSRYVNRRVISRHVLDGIASGVMQTIEETDYLEVPLSSQRVGR